jgi:hypothetical protein
VDKSLTKMIRSLSPKFPEWDETLQRFDRQGDDLAERENYDAEVRTIQEVFKILEAVLRVCTKVGGYKDDWDFPEELHLMICGIDTWVNSKKMGVQFEIGRYYRRIFLRTSVHAPHFLKKMDDEFWAWFLELRTLGSFSFEENARPRSQEGRNAIEAMRTSKSHLFALIRNYVVLETYEDTSEGLGSLRIVWPQATPWPEMLTNAAKAFRCFYRMNYKLYKLGGPVIDMTQFTPGPAAPAMTEHRAADLFELRPSMFRPPKP